MTTAAHEWPEPTRVTPLDLRFWAYHEANPVLYETLVRLALGNAAHPADRVEVPEAPKAPRPKRGGAK